MNRTFKTILLTAALLLPSVVSFASNKVFRVAFYREEGVMNITVEGFRSGVACEWMEQVALRNDWEIQWVDTTYNQALEALRNGEIDIVPAVDLLEDDNENFNLAHVITGFFRGYAFVFESKRTTNPVNGLDAFKNAKVGYVKGLRLGEVIKERLDGIGSHSTFLQFDELTQLESALISGDVDIALSEVTNVLQSARPVMALPIFATHFAISSSQKDLVEEFDKACAQILDNVPNFNNDLRLKYYPQIFESMARLSLEEHAWIDAFNREQKTIPVEIYPPVLPLKGFDEDHNQATGVVKTILDEISGSTGLRFSYFSPNVPEERAMKRIKNGRALLWIPYGCDTDECRELKKSYLHLASIKIPQVICTRHKNEPRLQPLSIQKKVAVCDKDKERIAAYVRMEQANNLYLCESYEDCFKALLNNEATYVITDYNTARETTITLGITDEIDISNLDSPRYEPELPILANPAMPEELQTILKKSILSMSDTHIKQIITSARIRDLMPKHLTTEMLVIYISLVVFFFLIIIIFVILISSRKTRKALHRADASLAIADVALREASDASRHLEQALGEAKDAATTKTRFLATMSHEIRTPLNAVIGFADFIDQPDVPSEKQREYAKGIGLAANALLSLINDILDLSKLDSGNTDNLHLLQGTTDMPKLFSEMATIFQMRCAQKGLELKFEIDREMPVLVVLEPRIRQILLNIIGNAVKYTEKGSIHVNCICTPDKNKEPGFVDLQFSVADTGIGISQSGLKRIFDPFAQDIESRQGKVFTGTGLGLAIVKRLIDASGGSITADSVLGKGTKFTVTLPHVGIKERPSVSGNANAASADGATAGQASREIKRVVLVDDIPMNRKILGMYLKSLGISEQADFGNAKDALTYLETHPTDLVLTDMWMPEMNGVEFATQLKEKHPELPVAAVTADADASASFDTSAFVEILNKPVTAAKLKALFERLEKGGN